MRGLFPGPGADQALRARLDRIAGAARPRTAAPAAARVDPASAARIMPRDRKRLVRALEVYFATGQPLTAHFAGTRSLIDDCEVTAIALRAAAGAHRGARGAARRRSSSRAASWTKCASCWRAACRRDARPFGGLVYRQIMEMLRGVRDEAATRALIAQENRRYARRQLIWFRKEPTLIWFDGPGETSDVRERVDRRAAVASPERDRRGAVPEETARDDARS